MQVHALKKKQLVLTLANSRAGFRQSKKHLPSIPYAALSMGLAMCFELSWESKTDPSICVSPCVGLREYSPLPQSKFTRAAQPGSKIKLHFTAKLSLQTYIQNIFTSVYNYIQLRNNRAIQSSPPGQRTPRRGQHHPLSPDRKQPRRLTT